MIVVGMYDSISIDVHVSMLDIGYSRYSIEYQYSRYMLVCIVCIVGICIPTSMLDVYVYLLVYVQYVRCIPTSYISMIILVGILVCISQQLIIT